MQKKFMNRLWMPFNKTLTLCMRSSNQDRRFQQEFESIREFSTDFTTCSNKIAAVCLFKIKMQDKCHNLCNKLYNQLELTRKGQLNFPRVTCRRLTLHSWIELSRTLYNQLYTISGPSSQHRCNSITLCKMKLSINHTTHPKWLI